MYKIGITYDKKRIELRSYHNVNGMLEKPILWDVNTSRQFREQNRKYPVYRMIYGIKYIEQRRAILSLSSWKFPTIHDRVYKYSGSSCVSFSRRHQILLVSWPRSSPIFWRFFPIILYFLKNSNFFEKNSLLCKHICFMSWKTISICNRMCIGDN